MEKIQKSRVISAELKEKLSSQFEIIKPTLRIKNDADVVRFLVNYYYFENCEQTRSRTREEVAKDKHIIARFEEKYGNEWRFLGENNDN